MSKEFASVFKAPIYGGPALASIKNSSGYPNWPDIRSPGNTDANQSAKDIMAGWDRWRVKRFEVFMEQFYKDASPWNLEYMNKSAPNFKEEEGKIIKCKLELIKRLLTIKMCGAKNLEDWCLLFLYLENELQVPQNIEELVRPESARQNSGTFMYKARTLPDLLKFTAILPGKQQTKYPGNMYIPGLDNAPPAANARLNVIYQVPSNADPSDIIKNTRRARQVVNQLPRGTGATRPRNAVPGRHSNLIPGNDQTPDSDI